MPAIREITTIEIRIANFLKRAPLLVQQLNSDWKLKRWKSARTSTLLGLHCELERKAKHKLKLSRQAGACVRGGGIVIVVVEVHRRTDETEITGSGQVCGIGSGSVAQCELSGITKLNMVENIECLHRQLHRDTLGEFGLFGER